MMKLPLVQNRASYLNRALSPEEEHIFESRLSTIWEGMMALDKKPEWEDIVPTLRSDVWSSRISSHIPVGIKRILISPHPPTAADLKSLSWSNTTEAGVLIWCSEGRRPITGEEIVGVYVGSASSRPGGLLSRRRNFLSRRVEPHDEALKRKTKDLRLNPKGHFGTLAIVPFENRFGGDILDVRAMSILTRFVLMIWLGAVGGELRSKTRNLVPWKLGIIRYIGLATGNPLKIDINKGDKTQRRKRNERRLTREERK